MYILSDATTFIHLSGNKRVPQWKKYGCFEAISQLSISSKGLTVTTQWRSAWSETNANLKEQHLVNTARGPICHSKVFLEFP